MNKFPLKFNKNDIYQTQSNIVWIYLKRFNVSILIQYIDFNEKNFKTPNHAPFLLALKSDTEVRNFMLVGDDCLLDLKTTSYCDAIYFLLCYYYCFDLSYPTVYIEFLTTFQVFCLKEETAVAKRGINYKKFESNLMQYLNFLN